MNATMQPQRNRALESVRVAKHSVKIRKCCICGEIFDLTPIDSRASIILTTEFCPTHASEMMAELRKIMP